MHRRELQSGNMASRLRYTIQVLSESVGLSSVPTMSSPDKVGMALHNAAIRGNKHRLKHLLQTGIAIDYPNDAGQTALFCAAFEAQHQAANTLLAKGADPNSKCREGSTPLHAAAYSCNIEVMCSLIAYGGDLRLHDNRARSVYDWVMYQPDIQKRDKMLIFLRKIKQLAMLHSGSNVADKKQADGLFQYLKSDKANSMSQILKFVRSFDTTARMMHSVWKLGFGQVYINGNKEAGRVTSIPLISEEMLQHDDEGLTYNNGPFMVNESMKWDQTRVTAKRLHTKPLEGGTVDLLINEEDHMARLCHPNILLLMGVCYTNNMDGVVLLYERVKLGSLYHHLHHSRYWMDVQQVTSMMVQISEALLYLHQRNLIHCNLTSHAICLVSESCTKLGNMEYMIENSGSYNGLCMHSDILNNKFVNAVYNWLAPEVLRGEVPTELSDMYSLCAIIWEATHREVPWNGLDAHDIMERVYEDSTSLLTSGNVVDDKLHSMLSVGMNMDLTVRSTLNIMQIKEDLTIINKESVINHASGKQYQSADEMSFSDSVCSVAKIENSQNVNSPDASRSSSPIKRIALRATESLLTFKPASHRNSLEVSGNGSRQLSLTSGQTERSNQLISPPMSDRYSIQSKTLTASPFNATCTLQHQSSSGETEVLPKTLDHTNNCSLDPHITVSIDTFHKSTHKNSMDTSEIRSHKLSSTPVKADSYQQLFSPPLSARYSVPSKIFQIASPCYTNSTLPPSETHSLGKPSHVSPPQEDMRINSRSESAVNYSNGWERTIPKPFTTTRRLFRGKPNVKDLVTKFEQQSYQDKEVAGIVPTIYEPNHATMRRPLSHSDIVASKVRRRLQRCWSHSDQRRPSYNYQSQLTNSLKNYRSEQYMYIMNDAGMLDHELYCTQESPPRLSPRSAKSTWFEGRNIKSLITEFQQQVLENQEKQAMMSPKNRNMYVNIFLPQELTNEQDKAEPTKLKPQTTKAMKYELASGEGTMTEALHNTVDSKSSDLRQSEVEVFYFDDEIKANTSGQERHLSLLSPRTPSPCSPDMTLIKSTISSLCTDLPSYNYSDECDLELLNSELKMLPARRESMRIAHVEPVSDLGEPIEIAV